MKPVLVALASAFLLGFLGCANEGPTGAELQDQFGRGIRGEGQVSSDIDRTGDPYVKPREGADRSHD
jgi:hypothetical protein